MSTEFAEGFILALILACIVFALVEAKCESVREDERKRMREFGGADPEEGQDGQ